MRPRRMSHDEKPTAPRRFLIDVEETIRVVLEQEDTDGDFQISITDAGPKILSLGTATSNGFKSFDIRVRYLYASFQFNLLFSTVHVLTHFLTPGHIYAVQSSARTRPGKGPQSEAHCSRRSAVDGEPGRQAVTYDQVFLLALADATHRRRWPGDYLRRPEEPYRAREPPNLRPPR